MSLEDGDDSLSESIECQFTWVNKDGFVDTCPEETVCLESENFTQPETVATALCQKLLLWSQVVDEKKPVAYGRGADDEDRCVQMLRLLAILFSHSIGTQPGLEDSLTLWPWGGGVISLCFQYISL